MLRFTIEVRTQSTDGPNSKVIGRFTSAAWDSIWGELQISRDEWANWRSAPPGPLIPDLPEISKLAYIDEGVVNFSPTKLNEECARLMPTLIGQVPRELIQTLLDTSAAALQGEYADMIVHPFS